MTNLMRFAEAEERVVEATLTRVLKVLVDPDAGDEITLHEQEVDAGYHKTRTQHYSIEEVRVWRRWRDGGVNDVYDEAFAGGKVRVTLITRLRKPDGTPYLKSSRRSQNIPVGEIDGLHESIRDWVRAQVGAVERTEPDIQWRG